MDSNSYQYTGLLESLSGSLFEQLIPLVDEYQFCKLKIKQLASRQAESLAFKEAQQMMALTAIINENERRLREVIENDNTTFIHHPQ